MSEPRHLGPETLSLHAGQRPDPTTGARAVPIYQSTSFLFKNTDQASALYNLEQPGHIYTRISNPTVAVLEERLAALEGGVGAICTSSGQAALHLGIATLLSAGDHIVASRALYGGSTYLLNLTLRRFGIETSFVDPRDPKAFQAAIRPQTRLLFGEVIGNPGLEILDVPTIAEIAHQAGLPLMIDSTFCTPILCQPFNLGADIVMHSVTKWLGGHGLAIGGVLIDSGRFDWQKSGRFSTMTEPYAGYDDIIFAEEYGPAAMILRARAEGLRDFGASMSPTNAFHLLQGVETLTLRMERHIRNTHAITEFLTQHPSIAWVQHPDLPSHPDYQLAQKLLPKGAGSVVTFGVKGGRQAGASFIDALSLISHLANVGDAKTLAIHPASTTHQQLNPEQMRAARLSEDLIRLSVGLESAADIIADLNQALKRSQKPVKSKK